MKAAVYGDSIIFIDVENSILENNIYGVDLNEESVEIAKLSLWLRTAQPRRKLTSLNNNIKCGNSIISSKSIAGQKAFSWDEAFPDISDKGGFDVIIGNPPYVDIKALDPAVVRHLSSNFECTNNRINLYSTFIEKSLALLKSNANFSFIIPSSLLTQESYKSLRRMLLNTTDILSIVRLPNESFGAGAGEVKVDTIILTFKKGANPTGRTEVTVYKGFKRISEISHYEADYHFTTPTSNWNDGLDHIFKINENPLSKKIVAKCDRGAISLVDCASFSLGLTPYDKYRGHTPEQIRNRVFHSNTKLDGSFRKLLSGNNIIRYNVTWDEKEWISYGDWLGAPRQQRFFVEKRIIVKQIIDWTDKRIWGAISRDELYNTQNAFNIIANNDFEPEYLLALINSKLISYYHRKKFLDEYKDRFQKILIKEAKALPIKKISLSEQLLFVEVVHQIESETAKLLVCTETFFVFLKSSVSIDLSNRKLQNWNTLSFGEFIAEINKEFKKVGKDKLSKIEELDWMGVFTKSKEESQSIEADITAADSKIEAMIFKLYGLSVEEIASVNESFS